MFRISSEATHQIPKSLAKLTFSRYTYLCLRALLYAGLTVSSVASAVGGEIDEVAYSEIPNTLKGKLCRPTGAGPFPGVIYNHGGLGNIIGGDPEGTCRALAAAGFVGFSPMRRNTRPLKGHPQDVLAGLAYLQGLDYVDRNRIGMIGFSRGGALTFMVAAQGVPIKAAVIMASASPPPDSGFTIDDARNIRVPVLLLVAENDTGSRTSMNQNTVDTVKRMSTALTAAGNPPKLIVYPPYDGDGHQLFDQVRDYWSDVLGFLKRHLLNDG